MHQSIPPSSKRTQIEADLDRASLIQRVHYAFDENAEYAELRAGLERVSAIRDSLPAGPQRMAVSQVCQIISVLLLAKTARLGGKIGTARRLEFEADQAYNQLLPREWRW